MAIAARLAPGRAAILHRVNRPFLSGLSKCQGAGAGFDSLK
jgi:hypothetical protein